MHAYHQDIQLMTKKILIVDDSPVLLNTQGELLYNSLPNAEIHSAKHGNSAITQAIRNQPDLIIINWVLPRPNELETISQLKQREGCADIPIIIISGSSSPDAIKIALEAGANDFIKKPIEQSELMARINAVLTLAATIRSLKVQHKELTIKNKQNESILSSLLPEPILRQIKKYGSLPPKHYRNNVVLFIDMVDFTSKSGKMPPGTLLKELQETFNAFDKVVERHKCTRIKTIGDAYMAVCGMFDNLENAELEASIAATKLRETIIKRNQTNKIKWEIKIGLYSGDVICGSVCTTNLSFDIFGETVNMASRLQEACEPMQINISKKIRDNIIDQYYVVERTPRKVKGKGVVPMYYIHRSKTLNSDTKKGATPKSQPLYLMN